MAQGKKLKRSVSKSFTRNEDIDIDDFGNINISNDRSTIYNLETIDSHMFKFVDKLSDIAPIDKENFMKDLVKIFHKNKLVPLTIETPCLICSRFLEHNYQSQLCGVTHCINSIYNPFKNTKAEIEPAVNAKKKVPVK